MEKYYLSSLESRLFENVHECIFNNKISLPDGRDLIIAKITPPVFINNIELNNIAIINRYKGDNLTPPTTLPCFVNVLIDQKNNFTLTHEITNIKNYSFIAVCELYKTANDAKNHIF